MVWLPELTIPPASKLPLLSTLKRVVPPSAVVYAIKSPDGAESVTRLAERIGKPFES